MADDCDEDPVALFLAPMPRPEPASPPGPDQLDGAMMTLPFQTGCGQRGCSGWTVRGNTSAYHIVTALSNRVTLKKCCQGSLTTHVYNILGNSDCSLLFERKVCSFGLQCHRLNPKHLAEFSHPHDHPPHWSPDDHVLCAPEIRRTATTFARVALPWDIVLSVLRFLPIAPLYCLPEPQPQPQSQPQPQTPPPLTLTPMSTATFPPGSWPCFWPFPPAPPLGPTIPFNAQVAGRAHPSVQCSGQFGSDGSDDDGMHALFGDDGDDSNDDDDEDEDAAMAALFD
eukprot:NODE_1018_length_1159_cov_328.209009_g766_i1.p1 GENE.NODE_1018_length_1159_cov_328.209009_g766_i1~~NODE_1018_length_1159_cov_328.209009_g766_i1.p1  ORF type:complete len:311 (-),score=60.02 NODE_1018_length_1159_cov_328.209009_g766_i1:226-1074(-)